MPEQREAWLVLRPMRVDQPRGKDAPRPGWGWCPLYDTQTEALAVVDGDLTMILRLILVIGTPSVPGRWIRG